MVPPLLIVDGVGKAFAREAILKSASFTAVPGRITALLGRNGSGKTTLLRIAAGRLTADYGRVLFGGKYFPRPRLHRLARQGLMYLDQEAKLGSGLTVNQQLSVVAARYQQRERVEAVIEQAGIEELLELKSTDLSLGERRRVSIAQAVVRLPTCLLADEPFSGVSPRNIEHVVACLDSLRCAGCAIVIAGHEVDDVLAVSSEVFWVVAGTTHYLGRPDEAARHHQFRSEYLGPRVQSIAPPPNVD